MGWSETPHVAKGSGDSKPHCQIVNEPSLAAPGVYHLLDRRDIRGRIIVVAVGRVNRDDRVDRAKAPAVDIQVGNQLVPVLNALFPRRVATVALIVVVTGCPPDIA